MAALLRPLGLSTADGDDSPLEAVPIPAALLPCHPGDVERTLVAAAMLLEPTAPAWPPGVDASQLMLLLPGRLLGWIREFGDLIVRERYRAVVRHVEKITGVELPWTRLIAAWAAHCGHARWDSLLPPARTRTSVLEPPGRAAVLGAEAWAEGTGVRLAAGSFAAVTPALDVAGLASESRQIALRLLVGPSWRADLLWAAELGGDSPAALARLSGASYATAHRVWGEITSLPGAVSFSPPQR